MDLLKVRLQVRVKASVNEHLIDGGSELNIWICVEIHIFFRINPSYARSVDV